MNKQNKGNALDIGSLLVIGAAAFQAYHMGRAFHVYDPDGWHFMNVNIGGLILGAILNFIVARAAIHLPTISATFLSLKELMPKVSKKADKKVEQARSRAMKKMIMAMKQNAYSQAGFYILIAFSALMVAPALYILWSKTLPFNWVFIAVMAFVGAIAPDIAITVGGFISSDAQRSPATLGAKVSDAGSDGQRSSATLKSRSAKNSATLSDKSSDAGANLYRCECGQTFTDRFVYSGHTGKCATRKALKASQDVIPVDLKMTSNKVNK